MARKQSRQKRRKQKIRAVVYALSPFQQKIMSGLWKDLPGKISHKVSENWISATFLLASLVETYMYVQKYKEKEKLEHSHQDVYSHLAFASICGCKPVTSTAPANKQTFIVQLERSKIKAAYQSLDNSRPWYEAMLNSIAEVSSQEKDELEATPPQLLYAYETAMFGFAASLSAKQLELLSKIDGFRYAIPDEELSLHTTRTPQFLGLEKGKGLWHSLKLKSDVIIGVVDTGIWPEHPSFQDHGLPPVPKRWKGACVKGARFSSSNCNRKLIGARFFFKGHEAANGKINETEYYKSARDSNGHGTHCASTAAGNLVENASLFGLANGTAAGKYRVRSPIAASWK